MADQLSGICWDVATRLFGCGRVHFGYAFKLKKNLKSLQTKWNELQNIREDVETRIKIETTAEMQMTREVSGWLHRVQNSQPKFEDIEAQGSQEIHNTCLRGCCPKNLVSSYKIGKKVVDKILKVDELVTSGKRFLDKNVEIAQRVPSKLVEEMPCGETVGLELMLSKVWNSLINDVDNVGIIGLYGMGGAGKTTLLKRVHNEFGKREHKFELVLWLVVSKDWNINKVMNDIRNKIGIQDDFWDRSSEEERAARINRILKQKRFVLMLDDLWGKLELERVGVPHPKDTGCQSKVVITTRSEDVCDKMQADVKLKVECLLENEAFDLFCKKVGEATLKCHREIPEIARDMARECGGLPLAIITVGSAMAGVKSVDSWRLAKHDLMSFPLTGPDFEKNVFSILMFSYDRLPDGTHKDCFLYCALYPEDYEIPVEDLIDRWIGEGFLGKGRYVSKRGIYDMREEGQSIIDKLKVSSLLEDATTLYDTPDKIKMHDVIRDMALWLARDQDENKHKVIVEREAFTMDSERLNDVERISIIDFEETTWEQVPVCPNLLTLCIQHRSVNIDLSNLQFMTRLKVLDLSRDKSIEYLPIEIGMLVDLEYFNLFSVTISGVLPIELKNLQKLRVFLVESHQGVIIPLEAFEGLKRLQVFRYFNLKITNEKEEIMLEKVESLPKLEELGVSLKTIIGLQKLFNSKKLQGCLRTLCLRRIKEPLEMVSLLGSWSTMKHLEILDLYDLHDIREVVSSITPHTQSLEKLRSVVIGHCHSITHLTWLRYAPFLESLVVSQCGSMEEVVKGDQDEVDVDVDVDVVDNNDHLFSNLKHLDLYFLPNLKSIHKRALHFPSLKYIDIRGCNELRKLPLNSNSAKDTLQVVIKGDNEWWNNLEWEDPTAKDLFHAKFESTE